MTIIPLKANLWTTISRVIICQKPIHDKSGDPARTRRNQEYGKEHQKPQQDDLLKFTCSQASSATENGNLTSMERLRNTLAMKVEEVHDLKVKVHELRFGGGNKEDKILLWNTKLEGDIGVFKMAVNDLDERIKELKSVSLQAAKKREEDQAAEIREQKYHEEMQFEKAKLEQKLKYEMQIEENRKNLNNKEQSTNTKQSINTKLPKLVITKFNRTHTDWPRFWNQFKAEINSADVHVSPVTKFSYLKELTGAKSLGNT